MIKNQDVSFVFWLGVMTVVALSVGCLLVFKNIKRTIESVHSRIDFHIPRKLHLTYVLDIAEITMCELSSTYELSTVR